ncbi:hypothetical protein [Plantactinospora sp. KLBMP9567]|uniref:hypothetical protein n=1 Tax=Plantactinospora sp. KLBMP9567 TaxID=3085900 RepID=UPI00298131EB|nr:hypothetical protein [Plantactinospora sp. KLBMP9567]MDW5322356.1 hypothetical protein [Plantactinospora sp. KLBMP9567]
MEIRFDFGDERGRVLVEVVPNTDPVAVGKSERDLGMPVCTASVEFSACGYRSLLGWVQLVREPSAADPFEVDPFDLFTDSSAPFAWYGFRPVLFDAPSRWRTGAVQWQAHSFLTIGPWDGDRRLVVPLVGFAWGYHQDSRGELHLSPLHLLGPADWNGHRPYLAEQYPTWRFGDGDPLAPRIGRRSPDSSLTGADSRHGQAE